MPVFFLLFLVWTVAGQPARAQSELPELPPACEPLYPAVQMALDEARRFEQYEPLLEASQALRACPGLSLRWQGWASSSEVWALRQQGRLDAAQEVLAVFFDRYAPHASESVRQSMYRQQARLHSQRALALAHTGRPLEAVNAYRAAIAAARPLAPSFQARILLDLSAHYAQLADLTRALHVLDEIEVLLEDAPPDLLLEAELYTRRADLWLAALSADASTFQAALDLSGQSLALLDAADGGETERVRIFALSAHQQALSGLGRYPEALEAASEALAYARRYEHPDFVIQMLRHYGEALRRVGRLAEAREALEEGIALAESQPRWLSLLSLALGRVHETAGRDDLAERAYRRAIDAVEAERSEFGVSGWAATHLARRQDPYLALVSLALRQGRPAEAFAWLDAPRARALRDFRHAADVRTLPPPMQAYADSLHLELQSVRAEMAAAGPSLDLTGRAAVLEAALARLVPPPPPVEPLDLPALQTALGRQQRVLLSYSLAEPAHAFVVTSEAFHAVPLPVDSDSLLALLAPVQEMAEHAGRGDREAVALEALPLQRLYDAIFRPVEPLIPDGSAVVVVPPGPLAFLPFGMLVGGEAPRFQYHVWPFLVHRYAFSTELAASLLVEEASPSPAYRFPVVAFGRTHFERAAPPPPFPPASLQALPHVAAELRALRRIVPGARVALDADARHQDLLPLLAETRVLHLASHAFAHAENPFYSAVLLTDTDGVGTDPFYLYELAGRAVPAELVVLSGCSTASGPVLAGEGIMGLQYAFRAAGAHASLAMRWQVDDAATVFLMERFYHYLRRGLTKDLALQRAQLDYIDAHERLDASPFFWAAADLSGSVVPVGWHRSALPPFAWAALGLVLLIGALVLGRLPRSR